MISFRGILFRGLVLALALSGAGGAAQVAAAEPLVITALGDSLTAGFGMPAEATFPAQLEVALAAAGVAARVINAGVSGDTSAGGLARLDWSVGAATDLVIVELGANDGLRGLDPDAMRANLDAILDRLAARGIAVLLTGMVAPPNLGAEYGARFNAVFPELAARHGTVFFPFFLNGLVADPSRIQTDGLHPNSAGVAVVVENILPFVLDALAAAGKLDGGS